MPKKYLLIKSPPLSLLILSNYGRKYVSS